MSASLDDSALFDAMTAFWVEGENKGNEEGVKAAIASYIDSLDLGLLHAIIVSNRRQEGTALAEMTAHARRCGIAGGMKQ